MGLEPLVNIRVWVLSKLGKKSENRVLTEGGVLWVVLLLNLTAKLDILKRLVSSHLANLGDIDLRLPSWHRSGP